MKSHNARLWLIAVVTVAAGSWWQLPRVSADGPAPPPHVLYGAGLSTTGQLGLPGTVSPPQLFQILGVPFDDVIDAASGPNHTLILRSDGTVWSLGANNRGQLGLGNASAAVSTPTQIPTLSSIVKVGAGSDTSFAIDNTGLLWAWGNDASGQLGLGNPGGALLQAAPLAVALTGVTDVDAGSDFAVAALDDGTVVSWGSNAVGQLGGSGEPLRNTPGSVALPPGFFAVDVAANSRTALARSAAGMVMGWGSNSFTQITNIGSLVPVPQNVSANIAAIAVGDGHIVLARTNGTVLTRGLGNQGQLGTGGTATSNQLVQVPGLSNVVAVAAGFSHSVAVTSGGASFAWGLNSARQLGIASNVAQVNLPTQVSSVPLTARSARSKSYSTLFLHAPGEVAVAVSAPPEIPCAAPAPINVSATGFNTVSTAPTDLVLVLDESGSIGAANFNLLIDFAMQFVNAQDIGPTRTRIGVVMFASSARTILGMSSDKNQILNALNGVAYIAGNATCIGCGITAADTLLDQQGRPGAERSMVIATDGANNAGANFENVVTTAQQSSTLFAIGIGNAVDASQIDFIASDLPGVQTVFLTPDFVGLTSILSQLAVNIAPGVKNLVMTLDLSSFFQIAGPITVTSGNVSVNADEIRWMLPTLGAATQSIRFSLGGTGAGGTLPIFDALSYESTGFAPRTVVSPEIIVAGCPASVVLHPPQASHLVGQLHVGNVSVRDAFGGAVQVPAVVSVVAGPNAGASFNISPFNNAFVYSSNVSGTDELVASVPGYPFTASATVSWELPNKAPTVDAGADQSIPLNGSPLAAFTLAGSAADDGLQAPLTFEWTENGNPIGAAAQLALQRGAGAHTFTLTAFDGELSGSDAVTVSVFDPTPPGVAPIINGPPGDNGWYRGNTTVSWKVVDQETPVTSPGCAVSVFPLDGANQIAACDATSGGGTTKASVNINVDQTPPVVTAPGDETAEATSSAGAVVSYSGESATDATSGIAGFSCVPASGSVFPIGTTDVTCTASDFAGNSAMARSSVTVKDTTAPELTAPGNMTEPGDQPGGRIVTWAVSATDAVGPVTTECNPPSGSLFAYGDTLVSCVATDAYGNSDTGTFVVTITDATPPEVSSIVAGTLGLNGWYTSDVTIDWTVNDPQSAIISSTGCADAPVTSDGVVTSGCSATSAGGTASATVTVNRDASPPLLTTAANLSVPATSLAGAVVSYAPATAADPTSGVTGAVSCAPLSGSTFPIGVTTVTCTAVNGAGLQGAGSFTVTVKDPGEPGKMRGEGHVSGPDNHKVEFDFTVFETPRGSWGDVRIKVKAGRRRGGSDLRFDARMVDAVFFSDAPDYGPGRNSRTGIDTVTFTGTGRWDGQPGFTFVVTASDRGEPGRGRDTFTIEIRAPNGSVVFSGGGTLSDGNVESSRLKRGWSWWNGHPGRGDDDADRERGKNRGRER